VNDEELSPAQRKKAHRERCYKLVSLLHLRGGNYVYAAVAVVPGNRHELPVLYQLVEAFVRHVGPGVMKKLILDRGFIDGGRIAYCKTVLGVDVLIPLKKNLDLWQDAWTLAQRLPWQEWIVPAPAPGPVGETTGGHRAAGAPTTKDPGATPGAGAAPGSGHGDHGPGVVSDQRLPVGRGPGAVTRGGDAGNLRRWTSGRLGAAHHRGLYRSATTAPRL
jgi:hypothetical protein